MTANAKTEFAVLSSLLVVTRFADLYITYRLSPDLTSEANPLVSVLHFHWTGLIFISVLLCFLVGLCLYYDLFDRQTAYPSDTSLPFADFAPIHWFGRKRHVLFFLLAFAKNWDLRIKYIGFAGTRLLIFSGMVAVLSWLGLAYSAAFEAFYSNWFPVFPYGFVVIGAVFLLYLFLQREYVVYRDQHEATRTIEPE